MRLLTVLLFLFCSLTAHLSFATILPPNDLYKEDDLQRKDANLTEAEFHRIIDSIVAIYAPIVAQHDAQLDTNQLWTDPTVNASAQQIGKNWIVNMYGGLARRPEVTADGFALVVCHELGHHLAGFPFYAGGDWAASEGQADYFATQACAREIWKTQYAVNAGFRKEVHPIVKASCDAAWHTAPEQNLCYRIGAGGYSLAKLLAVLGSEDISFETPSSEVAATTMTSHPPAQCRLDTYFYGGLCDVRFDRNLIPARFQPEGQESIAAEITSTNYSCTTAAFYETGFRPRCWFKPNVESLLFTKEFVFAETKGNRDGYIDPGETFQIMAKLENLAKKSFSNIQALLNSASQHIRFSNAQNDIPVIQPGQTVPASFLAQVSRNAECGEKIPINLRLNTNGRQTNKSTVINVGHVEMLNPLLHTLNIDIPDGDPNGLSDSIEINDNANFQYAEIAVDITHPYIGDITVQLIAPDQKTFMLHDREGGSQNDIHKTYKIDLGKMSGKGLWTLKIVDPVSPDPGVLNQWSLSLGKSMCGAKKRR